MNSDEEIRTKKLQSACINALLEEDYKFSIEDNRITLIFDVPLPDGNSSENIPVKIYIGAFTLSVVTVFEDDIPKDSYDTIFEFILRINSSADCPFSAKLDFTFADDSDDFVSICAHNTFGHFYDDRDVAIELLVMIDDVLELYCNCAYPLRRIIDAGMDAETAFNIYRTIAENNRG